MPPPLGAAAPAPAATAPSFIHLALSTRRRVPAPRAVAAASMPASHSSHEHDALLLHRAADVADRSAGLTSPHPNFGCVIARPQRETDSADSLVVGEGFLYAQGTPCAELLAAQEAGEHARGATAYLNLEPGDCYGDSTAVRSLVQVLGGIAFPIPHSHLFLQIYHLLHLKFLQFSHFMESVCANIKILV
jgi:diaminohydroxyphosphoribosylaminopyrimidine deaminase / 5-amino-6-(5-phosphoribosylamino)uracil reductase